VNTKHVLLIAAVILLAGSGISQIVVDDGRPPAKEHPAELEKLSYGIGTWDSEVICRASPDAKEFKARAIAVVQWSANGQFLISDEWDLMPGGNGPWGPVPQGWLNKLVITTWNPIKKEYVLVNILAVAIETRTMTVDGRIGTIRSETHDGSHITETVTTTEHVSDTEFKFRSECSVDHGPKWVFSEGTSKKRSP
jgi:hypothetical protein